MGIDGFAVDVLVPHATSDVNDRILQATAEVGNFTVMIGADMTGPLGVMTAADFAADVAPYLTAGCVSSIGWPARPGCLRR